MSRRLITALARLYPKAWRERYEEELAALSLELLERGETTRLRRNHWAKRFGVHRARPVGPGRRTLP